MRRGLSSRCLFPRELLRRRMRRRLVVERENCWRVIFLYSFSECSRRDAGESAEGGGEVALARKPGPQRYLHDGQLSLKQEPPRHLDATPDDVTGRRHPHRLLERPREVAVAHADLPGHT